ncbi:ImmA/IrrE family metallo-endopeptidase [Paenibacillus sp. LMG 31461]|uniref:ImmA/IrrE family metallo-endopeptidase n=1 Tax=Paenibacillus plantarum TaxID=2654975 RepID=A0ABX1X406_9BACL|nr:ImmA/IrrE family metallo-endopeptidase [Paenibacillus plantarum]NOU63148.1 ImmA/IrrE family metallo-endopeptidase [Paenibacillus plantarum]
MNLTHYKLTDLELWINEHYLSGGILSASDMKIKAIADLFDIDIVYYEGPCVADWDDPDNNVIFIDSRQSFEEQREAFFHELCHPLRHIGNQEEMTESFIEFQEIQATQFQYCASLPIYLLQDYMDASQKFLTKILAGDFMLSEKFVIRRLEQIKQRIYISERDERMKEARKIKVVLEEGHVERVIAELVRQRKVMEEVR